MIKLVDLISDLYEKLIYVFRSSNHQFPLSAVWSVQDKDQLNLGLKINVIFIGWQKLQRLSKSSIIEKFFYN